MPHDTGILLIAWGSGSVDTVHGRLLDVFFADDGLDDIDEMNNQGELL